MPIQVLDSHASEAAFSFLDRQSSARGAAHWRWKYPVSGDRAPAFIWNEPDGTILGFIGLMRTTLYAGGRLHPAAWFVDWHVTPSERAVGVGLGLLRKAEATIGTLFTLQGSADTRQILPRLGWRQSLAPVTWVRPVTTPYIAQWIRSQGLAQAPAWLRPLSGLVAAAVRPYFRCRQPAPLADVALVDAARVPTDYDAVWQARANELPAALARDSAYLNYLCADFPDKGYRLQLLRLGGDTVGHLIWRVDAEEGGLQRGRIVDVVWPQSRADIGAWLVQSACWQLERAGADYIECLLSTAALREAVAHNRFRARRPVAIWYHRLPAGVPDPDHWYITLLDCDRAYR